MTRLTHFTTALFAGAALAATALLGSSAPAQASTQTSALVCPVTATYSCGCVLSPIPLPTPGTVTQRWPIYPPHYCTTTFPTLG